MRGETEPVPVEREPHHRWTFENQYVRVLDVVLAPGESTGSSGMSCICCGARIGNAPQLAKNRMGIRSCLRETHHVTPKPEEVGIALRGILGVNVRSAAELQDVRHDR